MRITPYLLFLSLILALFSLSLGASSQFSWEALFAGDGMSWSLFWESRLPRTLAIILASGSLSLSGLLVQTITQNTYAAPSTVGTVEAAQLGMLLALFFYPQPSLGQKMLLAFVSALVFTALFLHLSRFLAFRESWQLPLMGMVYGGMIGAVANLLAYRFNLVQSLASWSQGSFAMVQTHQYEWLFLSLVLVAGCWYFAEAFTLMGLGQETAQTLGLAFAGFEVLALGLVALTTAVTMITVGALPFLGVIVPNIIRRRYGDHLKKIQGLVFLTGTSLTLACDILGRLLIRPYEIPVAIVLGSLGAVVFIGLLWRGGNHA